MIVDNSNTFIKVLETNEKIDSGAVLKAKPGIPVKKTEKKKKDDKQLIKIQTASSSVSENILPLTEKQRAEFELFEQLINS